MFAQNPSLKRVDARPSDIITLLVSTNRPLVALSGPQQQADAFIVSVDRGKTQPVYLCFHIIKEGQRLIYTSNTVPTSQSARTRIERDALRFAEDMGFMMVREQFDGLSAEQREDAIMGLAPFVDDISQVKHEQKRAKTQKKDQAEAAESELEYEEVYEEVEEEVPIEEEPTKPEEYESLSDVVNEVSEPTPQEPAADTGEKAKAEEYESLSDVVNEVSAQAPQEPAADTAEKAKPEVPMPKAPIPDTSPAAQADEQAFDLGRELSDVVETIREMPEGVRPVREHPAERPAVPEHAAGRREEPEPEPAPREKPLPERQQAIVKLLITL
jgi:hypothetical protein